MVASQFWIRPIICLAESEVSVLEESKDGFHDTTAILFSVIKLAEQFKVTCGGPKTIKKHVEIIMITLCMYIKSVMYVHKLGV